MLKTPSKLETKEKPFLSFLSNYDIRSLSVFTIIMFLFSFFMFLPILTISGSAFNISSDLFDEPFEMFKHFRFCIESTTYRESIINSLFAGLMTTVVCSIIGLTVTIIFSRYRFRGKRFFQTLTILPLVSPPFVGAYAISMLLKRNGIISNFIREFFIPTLPDLLGNSIWAVVFIQSIHLWPLIYYNTAASYSKLDPAMEEQARNLGSWGAQLYRQIIIPLITPGFVAGGVLVFIWSIADLGTPIVLNFHLYAPYVAFKEIKEPQYGYPEAAYALIFIILLISIIALLFASKVVGMKDYAPEKVSGMEQIRLMQDASRSKTILFCVMLGVLFFLSLLPHIGIIIVAFVERIKYGEIVPTLWSTDGVKDTLGKAAVIDMILNSLFYALLAMIFTTVIGVAIAIISVRKKNLRGISTIMLIIGSWVGLMLGAQFAIKFNGTFEKTLIMILTTIILALVFFLIGRFLNVRCLEIFSTMPFAIPGVVLAAGYIYFFGSTTSLWGLLPPQLDMLPILGTFTEALRDSLLPMFGRNYGTSDNPQWGVERLTSFWFIFVISYSMRRMPYTVQSSTAILRQIHEALEEVSYNLGASTNYTVRRITLPLMTSGLIAGGILTFVTSFTEVSTSIMILPTKQPFKPIFPFTSSADPLTKGIYDEIGRGGDSMPAGVLGLVQMGTATFGMALTQKTLGEKTGTVFGGG